MHHKLLGGMHRDQSDLCEAFWEQQEGGDGEESMGGSDGVGGALAPLAGFLASARDIFPAAPLPLLTTLSAFAQKLADCLQLSLDPVHKAFERDGSAAAVHAYLYLKNLPALSMLHDGSVMDSVVRRGSGASKEAIVTASRLQLPWE
eukprot:scaffold4562_cov36-Prasinocladus_malaysianus.AAC.2